MVSIRDPRLRRMTRQTCSSSHSLSCKSRADPTLQKVTYTAFLPKSNTTGIRGYVAATSNGNGTGVKFNVNVYGLPDASFGPFRKSSIALTRVPMLRH